MLDLEHLFVYEWWMPAPAPVGQRSFDELGTPLHEVTFCVIDLETTGGSPTQCAITEIGAVKLRGGECLGTFQTLVNPGLPLPPEITVLTGITEAMVLPAPTLDEVLPSLLEFVGGAVVVGHNVRFDLGFLRSALDRSERPRLGNRSIDTFALARRLVRDEVPNLKLGTLASRLRLGHSPTHRALDDALATGELLHVLLERAAGLGVTGLDDLLALPTMSGHAQAGKLKLTTGLPRSPGVYLFRDRHGRVLYVGKATNLRARVRSYFSGDDRRKIGALLRETQSVDHIVCPHPLEAAVLEVRLIHEHVPRYNRRSRDWQRYVYLKLTLDERFPRLSIVRTARDDRGLYLGPLGSRQHALRIAEAIEGAAPLRRCTRKPASGACESPCAPAQLGVATCPCSGSISERDYDAIVQLVVRGLTTEPELLLEPLRERMSVLAEQERFEEATDVRERASALAVALQRQRRIGSLVRAGRLVVEVRGQGGAELCHGVLVRAWSTSTRGQPTLFDGTDAWADLASGTLCADRPIPKHLADELQCVASWLDERAQRVRIIHCDDGLASRLPLVPSFKPVVRRDVPVESR
jgi:DNA polymerase-3 subunit epsilon